MELTYSYIFIISNEYEKAIACTSYLYADCTGIKFLRSFLLVIDPKANLYNMTTEYAQLEFTAHFHAFCTFSKCAYC